MTAAKKDWFFYMLRCRDNSLYSGMTNNLEERVKKHDQGTASRYTSSHRPVTLIYSERFESASGAKKREGEVKRWTKSRKEELIVKRSQATGV